MQQWVARYLGTHDPVGLPAIRLLWSPKQAPELSALDQLWRELNGRSPPIGHTKTIDALAAAAIWMVLLTPTDTRRKAGAASRHLRLK